MLRCCYHYKTSATERERMNEILLHRRRYISSLYNEKVINNIDNMLKRINHKGVVKYAKWSYGH